MTLITYNRRIIVTLTAENGSSVSEQEFKTRKTISIEKSISKYPNTATIRIFNPNSNLQAIALRENVKIEVFATYADNEGDRVFKGDIKRAYSINANQNNILKIEAGDAETAIATKEIYLSYGPGTAKITIVEKCLDILGLKLAQRSRAFITGSYNGAFVANGKVINILDTIIKGIKDTNGRSYEYSIQDEQFIIAPYGSKDANIAVPVKYSPGLLLAKPIKLQDGGLSLITLLDPRFRVHGTIDMQVEGFQGLYQIRQLKFQGDSTQGDWKTEVICL